MANNIDNIESVKSFKKKLRNFSPELWESFVRWAWEVRTTLPPFEPAIFSQLRKVSEGLKDITPKDGDKKRILFFQTRSNPPHLAWAGTMALALASRGNETLFLGCSGDLKDSCNNANYPEGLSASRCRICHIYARRFFNLSGINNRWIKDYIIKQDISRAEALIKNLAPKEYETFKYNGISLGKIARHSVAHYLRTGTIGDDELSRDVYRRFLINSIIIADTSNKLIDKYKPDVVLMLCGLFMPEHVMMEIAHQRGIRVVVYEIAMLAQDALMMQHDRPIDYDDKENWVKYKDIPLAPKEEQVLDNYLFERSQGRMSVVNYWPEKEDDEKKVRKDLSIDPNKKTAILFPNITWDSALFEKDIAFDGMFDWLDLTIEYFVGHSEYQLIIRAHPAEVILPGSLRESVISYIRDKHRGLPKNIILVPPESKISSYTLMDLSDCGFSYASTTAVELGIRGIPVMVAGEVHFRNKGFTIDIDNRDTYFNVIDKVVSGNISIRREEIIKMARRYAYFTFFRTSMPFNKVHCGAGDLPVFTYSDISALFPGKDKSLDTICNGIISGTPFIFE